MQCGNKDKLTVIPLVTRMSMVSTSVKKNYGLFVAPDL